MREFQIFSESLIRLTFSLLMLFSFFWGGCTAQVIPQANVPMLNLTVGEVGEVGIAGSTANAHQYGIEYRSRSFSQWKIIPAFGYARAENSADFLYIDLRRDFWLTDRWIAIPSFGLGAFDDSEEIQLGGKLEFRVGIEIAYRFHRQYRVGVAIFHFSNAGLSDSNPGTEALVLSLSIPLEY